jgi:hypothetical protein
MVGGNYKINDLISINPNALIRLAADLPNSWEVNVTANLMQLVDFGVGYRSMNSFSTNLGVNFNSKIYLGYLYEMPTTEMSQVSNQTHEIVLRYRLIKDNSPQFYKRKKSFKEIIDVRKYFKRR